MFGGSTFGGGFGQPQQQPQQPAFGAPAAPAFGAQQPAASPFGAPASTGGLFGAQTPAFGQATAATPAFGRRQHRASVLPDSGPPSLPGSGSEARQPQIPLGPPEQQHRRPLLVLQPAPLPLAPALGSAPSFGAGLGGTPAFGAAATPAFGVTSAPAAFGATSAPAFGAAAASTPAFGASTTTGFGGFGTGTATAPSPFGAPAAASPFGATTTSGFGAAAPSAFGAAAQPQATGAFGAAAPSPFGGAATTGGLFGAAPATNPFGTASQPAAGGFGMGGAFGGAIGATQGTRSVAWSKTKEPEQQPGAQAAFFMSISAMPNFNQANNMKSHEELRWEDYQAGIKGYAGGAAPTAFGAPAAQPAAPGGFGFGGAATPAAGGAFGAAPAASAFGAAPASPFGAASTPAFGAAAATTTTPSLFGNTATTGFGGTTAFGAASSPAAAFSGFGTTTTAASSGPSMFGAASSPSVFGGTTFGAAPFGAASSAAAFGFSSSPSLFGASSAAASPFGAAPATTASPFGGTGAFGAVASPFGAASSASAFGTSTFGAFGATAAKPATPFGSAPSPFGAASAPGAGAFSFTSPPPTTGSLFAPSAGTTMSFGTGLFAGQAAAPGGTLLGFGGTAAAAPVQPPTVAQPAYGSFSALPAVPEPKVGLTTRPVRNGSISSGTSKASPLLSLRPSPVPVRYGAQVLRSRSEGLGGGGVYGTAAAPAPSAGALAAGDGLLSAPPGSTGGGLLPLRANPHRLFITAPPPSTDAAGGSSFLSPVRVSRDTPPGRGRTPDGGSDGLTGLYSVESGGAEGTAGPAPRSVGYHPYENGTGGAHADGGGGAVNGTAGGRGFQDGPSSEPYLPRLGRLVSEGFSFSPNVDELRLLHNQNPANLAQVSNFTVSRAGVGQVRWVVPVDVRGVSLQDIIVLNHGEAIVYPDPATKPPQGQGLNQPAEITFYGVYRKDKETGAVIRDGPKAQAYEKALRQMCAKMGAKFVIYKQDGGVWKFEVEHFSRYGLLDLDDADNETDGAAADGQGPETSGAGGAQRQGTELGAAAGRPRKRAVGALGLVPRMEEEDGVGMAGFSGGGGARGTGGAPAASAVGRPSGLAPAAVGQEDSEMEPSVRLMPGAGRGGGGSEISEAAGRPS